jgi:hypothetical protein
MRFRFTIRDLLWLTLVVGLIVGWWLDRRMQPYSFHTNGNGYIIMKEKATGIEWYNIDGKWMKTSDIGFPMLD